MNEPSFTRSDRRFGWWVRIADEASARYAIRMAGLPIFLLGMSALVVSIPLLFLAGDDGELYIAPAILGVVLCVCGVAIRNGRASVLFVVGPLYALNLACVLLRRVPFDAPVTITASLMNLLPAIANYVLALFLVLLVVSGLRGWFWLRHHGKAG